MDKVLTIAIPTYNHHNYLKRQLVSVLPQITDEIDLVIFDNNSHPSISEYLQFEGIDITGINIIVNERNIGADANIENAYFSSKTNWVWVLSDNDFVNSTSVSTVLSLIKNHNETVFINLVTKDNQARLLKGYHEFMNHICYWSSFSISHILFNLKKLSEYRGYYKNCMITHQPQLLTLLKYLKENNNDSCFLIDVNIFEDSIPAKWSKPVFINDGLNVYNLIPKEDLKYFNNTIGRQMIKTFFYLLIASRIQKQINLRSYNLLLFKIIKKSPFLDLILNKHFYFSLVCFLNSRIVQIIKPYNRVTFTKRTDSSNFNSNKNSLQWDY